MFLPYGRGHLVRAVSDPEPTFVSSPADRWVYRGAVIRTTRISSSRQLVEQRLRLFQIGGVEALGEPAVDRREQFARFGPPALFAPQPGEARRGAQFLGFRLLPSRDAQCLFEGDLALFEPVETDERDAFEAMKLRIPQSLARFFLHSPTPPSPRQEPPPCSPCRASASAKQGKAIEARARVAPSRSSVALRASRRRPRRMRPARSEPRRAAAAVRSMNAEPLLGSQRLGRFEPLQRQFRLAAIEVKHRVDKAGRSRG